MLNSGSNFQVQIVCLIICKSLCFLFMIVLDNLITISLSCLFLVGLLPFENLTFLEDMVGTMKLAYK